MYTYILMNSFPIKTSIHKGFLHISPWFSYLLGPHLILAGVREDVAVVQSGSRGPQAQRGVNGVLFFPFLCHLAQLRLRAMAKVARVSIGILAKWDPCWRDPCQICQWNSFKEENLIVPVVFFLFLFGPLDKFVPPSSSEVQNHG